MGTGRVRQRFTEVIVDGTEFVMVRSNYFRRYRSRPGRARPIRELHRSGEQRNVSLGGFDEILSAAQADEGWAFSRLHGWLVPAVSAYVRMQGIRDEEDVVSEVFLAVFSRLGGFSGTEAQFRSWVFTIAHHRIVDARRTTSRTPRMEDLDCAEWVAAETRVASAEDVAMARVELARLRTMLDRLSPDQRTVLLLRVVADLSVAQVAEAVGKQPSAVRALQYRAVLAVRRELAPVAAT